jgi:ribonuclease D
MYFVANMRFLLPEAPVMLRFLQRNRRARARFSTITQKHFDNKIQQKWVKTTITNRKSPVHKGTNRAGMISQGEIDTALAAADRPIMLESDEQLRNAMDEWLACESIGIDTEFVRERTWRAELGLIQVSDGRRVWLVDTVKCASIAAFARLLEDRNVVKILHAPSEDLDVLLYNTGAVPTPLFDTQTACAMLGESLQMAYHNTVEWLLGIAIDKGETRSDWIKRPLRPAQLHYAALDVCLLPMMFRTLTTRLTALERLDWLWEDCERMLQKALTPASTGDAWKRINGNGRLDGASLAILQALAKWRDEVAEKRNLARGFVIKDAALLTIARQQPDSVADLSDLNVWHPRAIQRHGERVIAVIHDVLEKGLTAAAPDTLLPKHRPMLHDMRRLVISKATRLHVEPALLASKRELESLILTPTDAPLPEKFLGWRNDVITTGLLEIRRRYG